MLATTSSVSRNKSSVIPTNSVTTKEGKTVRARIDPTLPVTDVVRQLCLNLKISQPPAMFALRDEHDQLVTDDNLRRNIRERVPLKLVNSPAAEALEAVSKLAGKHDNSLRLTLFSLQKFIREEQFVKEFLRRGGLPELILVIESSHGNTLAYALTAMRNLMDLEYGWGTLEASFISRVSQVLSTPITPINVCRPATAILRKLVEADPRSAPGPAVASSSRSVAAQPAGSVWRYGFDVVWAQIRRNQGLLDILVQRLASAESGMAICSMMLINTLLSHATEAHWEEVSSELERLNVRKAVILLMTNASMEDLTSSILDFQANVVRIIYKRKTTPVDMDLPEVQSALDLIWTSAKIEEYSVLRRSIVGGDLIARSSPEKWVHLGFRTENLRSEFARVGLLGLDCLRSFVAHDPEYFAKVVLEQLNRQPERRCPLAAASSEVVELLTDHWSVFAPGYSTSASYQPLLLSFYRVHCLATRFFLRMWNESSASHEDFPRVTSLVQSQIKVALANESSRPWHEVESCFNVMQYRQVRDRQMKELELQDDLLNKPPVRNLRAKLHKESYEFVRQQRIMCMMQGAWFANGIPIPTSDQAQGRDSFQLKRPSRPWRFYRLDRSMKFLHFVDSPVKIPIRGGLEDLPERLDISLITEIPVGTCALPPNIAMPDAHTSPFGSAPTTSPLSFSIVSSHGTSGDHVSENAARFSDWTDGLNMLRNNQVLTKETASFVQTLTEIGLKIKLLDLSGEKVDIPTSLPAGPPPLNADFFFSDPVMFTT